MIPVRLQLKNFMSYGEGVPPLDFTGMRVACLSGDNGAGKTAILDALTWALWGETRAPNEDDLIRIGATDCRVLLDFLVNGVKYRVHKARARRGGSVWELQIWQEDGTPRALSGANSRETKQKLQDLLRMDYKTFLASAFLAQGRADEFTRAPVAERKKVLADILDLSRYERLEQMAKERRGDAEARLLDAERELRAIDAELEHEEDYRRAREQAEKTLEALLSDIEVEEGAHERLTAQVQRLAEREEKAAEYEAGIREREEEIADHNEMLAQARVRIAAAEEVLARRAEIESDRAALQKLQARIGPLEEQDQEARLLESEGHALQLRINQARNDVDNERYGLARDADAIEREGADITRLDTALADLDAEIARFGDPEDARRQAEAERDAADREFVELKSENGALKAQIEGWEKRLAALQGSDAPLCEYCGQPLSREKRQRARVEAEAERDRLQAEQREIAARGGELNRLREQLRRDAERAQADLRTVAGLRERRAQLEQNRLRLVERGKDLPRLREKLAGLERTLADRSYAQEDQERLVQVSARREKLERVAQELAAVRAELSRLAGAERQFALLGTAETTVATAGEEIARHDEVVAKRRAAIERAHVAIVKIRQETAVLPVLRRDLDALTLRLQSLRVQERAARSEIDRQTVHLNRCANLREERVRRADEQKTAAKEKQVYTELAGAFGKRGVQALIIENALPEIQDVANDLLGRMTQGGMQIQLVTQREAKTKGAGAIETLDIIISDDMGTRPYEMYSGGEAFRINFALRIALSKMLARRAGAPLQTLILDEGFGTQDPRGRESILDALTAVSDDFALVLVITHIEELKDQFPTRIEVVKGQDGSTFTVA